MSGTNRMTCSEAIDLARRWIARGVPAFPIAIKWDEQKQSTNKSPLTPDGHLNATTDPAELVRLFNARSPGPGAAWGVGLWPGPAGYAVVDVDVKSGAGGDDTWAALRAEHGDVDTYTATTATTGAHLWGGRGGLRLTSPPSKPSSGSVDTTRSSAVTAPCSSPDPARPPVPQSIGHIGPGIVKVFTPNWPPLKQDGVYDADQLAEVGQQPASTSPSSPSTSSPPLTNPAPKPS